MERIVLDFSECKTWFEIHEEIQNKLQFPEYYGKNLDALWDCMRNYTNDDLIVEVIGAKGQTEENTEEINQILTVFDDVHKETPNVKFEIVS